MSRSSSGIVAGLTAAALAAVGFLAYQASANVPDTLGKPAPGASPSHVAKGPQRPRRDPAALPAHSGQGARVVYALKGDRVWLVDDGDKVARTFTVRPSTVDPEPGSYAVTSRTDRITGSDGVPIEHVVLFAKNEGVVIGFSSAQDGSMASPDPSKKTGGVRARLADGTALWNFATLGSKVVVVP
ncbi:hypothetical protein [Streptomyces tremellae]|uniref:L,D-transpeptidase n=1 Tax=Streptomyces tremellae TaxID=1124239 RepID=A0ABP7FAK2_9ACTN